MKKEQLSVRGEVSMASGILSPPPQPEGVVAPPTDRETFIDSRLRRTRRQVKSVDIAGGLMVLAAGTLAYLLTVAVLDHWVIAGGLGFWTRLLCWLLLLGVGGAFRRPGPAPVAPSHQSDLRRADDRAEPADAEEQPDQLPPAAGPSPRGGAGRVSCPGGPRRRRPGHGADGNVRRSARIVRLGYVLVALVVLFALYLVLSPKSPLVSVGRVLWPWSNVPAPTRVTLDDIRPEGDSVAFFGDTLERLGRRPRAPRGRVGDALLLDRRRPERRSGRFPAPRAGKRLPVLAAAGKAGLAQDVTYRLVAGDCTTRTFHVEVQIAPAIVVNRIDYHYPDYTGMADRSVPGEGDIRRALEGTRVTIHATANHEIQRAEIDLDCSGLHGVNMTAAGKTATGTFTLAMEPTIPRSRSTSPISSFSRMSRATAIRGPSAIAST